MIDSLKRLGQRLFTDFKARHNYEIYLVAAFAFLFALLSLFGDIVSDDQRTAIILAALGLLVFHLSVPDHAASSLDTLLNDRASFAPFHERIKGARKLWIYAPAAANILRAESATAIQKDILAYPDGEFRAIIQNPDETAAVNILVKQLDDSLDYQLQHLPSEIARTLDQFQLMKRWQTPGTFDYRLLDYGPGFSLVAIDPHKSSGVVIVEIHGFHNQSTDARMHIEITKAESERWFTYWTSQFEHMWQAAHPPADVDARG